MEKRKQEDGDRMKNKKRPVLADEDDTVKDEEVEEFFAILRRVNVAVKYFKSNKDGKKLWKPAFKAADFEDVDRRSKQNDDFVDENTGLDLNSDPPSEDI
ncbi:protein NEGATIVE REGULATOR OF RESISTANCE-like [Mercurialis annua]|uniref:protein NEGATIVE REGULATOR OF RESISTANCE-like n=1 Tax=Mercurialis annua TaxID=3986 RepID=UPI00215F84A0|nr:protein NEGATIVE REGULATOR OF RESISTANCE-like [Mercurialis annua]